jgi:hypothetical protein
MALQVKCSEGHSYIQADIYEDWPEGAPHCPACYEEWMKHREQPGVNGQGRNDFDSEGYTQRPALCANYWWDRERRAFVR